MDNNRLSCDIPINFARKESRDSNLIIYGNRFWEWGNELPDFVNPNFAAVQSLYSTKLTLGFEIIYTLFGLFAAFFLLYVNIIQMHFHKTAPNSQIRKKRKPSCLSNKLWVNYLFKVFVIFFNHFLLFFFYIWWAAFFCFQGSLPQ